MTNEEFWSWVDKEINVRELSYHRIERQAGLANATISKPARNQTSPSPTVCQAIAVAFGLSIEEVYRRAGLLPPLPPEVAEEKEAVRILRSMSAQQRAYVLTTMRAIAGHESTTQRLDPYQELLNIIWDMTPDELKERIVIRLQETVEEHEQEMTEH